MRSSPAQRRVAVPQAPLATYRETGTAPTMGIATLVGGTKVVTTTAVTANSRIFLSPQTLAGTPGLINISARTPGTSFTITSLNPLDVSVVAWFIVEPQ